MRKALLIVSVAVFGLSFGGGEQAVSTFTDKRDGKVYRIVEIGGAVWMAENLNFAAEGSKCYKDSAEYCAKYGRLYNWETALKACPAGTHLPSDKEWTTLVDYAGGWETAGKKLKSSEGWAKGWDDDNGNGTDYYGFSALPGGGSNSINYGAIGYVGDGGYWWSATVYEYNAKFVYYRSMSSYGSEFVIRYYAPTKNVFPMLFSVRCVQDKESE